MINQAIEIWTKHIEQARSRAENLGPALADLSEDQQKQVRVLEDAHIKLAQQAKEYMELFAKRLETSTLTHDKYKIADYVGRVALVSYKVGISQKEISDASDEERLKIAIKETSTLFCDTKGQLNEEFERQRKAIRFYIDTISKKERDSEGKDDLFIGLSEKSILSILKLNLALLTITKKNADKLVKLSMEDGSSFIDKHFRDKEMLATIVPTIIATSLDLWIGQPVFTPVVGPGSVVIDKYYLATKRKTWSAEALSLAKKCWWQNTLISAIPQIATSTGHIILIGKESIEIVGAK